MSQGGRKRQGAGSNVRQKADGTERSWRFWSPTVLFALAFMFAAVVAGPYLATLLPDLSQQPEYQFSLLELRVTPPNPWVPPDLIARLIQQGELPEQVSLLDPELTRTVGRKLEQHPWIRKVEMVRITGEPVLQAFLDYRRPVMSVETAGSLYPVDVDGVVLPPRDFRREDLEQLPRLKNIHSKPPAAGQPWPDQIVREGVKLADAICQGNDLDRHWKRFGIVAIVAPDPLDAALDEVARARLLEFHLLLEGGSWIVWGPAPGSDSLDASVEQKLAKLESLEQQGLLKQLRSSPQPRWFDVRDMIFGSVAEPGVNR